MRYPRQVKRLCEGMVWPADKPFRVAWAVFVAAHFSPPILLGPSHLDECVEQAHAAADSTPQQKWTAVKWVMCCCSCRPCQLALIKLPQQPLHLMTPSLPLCAGALEQAGKSQLAAFSATFCGLLHIWALPPRSHSLRPPLSACSLVSAPHALQF